MRRIGASLRQSGRSRLAVATLFVGISAALVGLMYQPTVAELNGPAAGEREVTRLISRLLQRIHLARKPLDDEMSGRAMDNFLKTLDPMKIHFLKADVEEFNEQRAKLDDQLKNGDTTFAYAVFRRFLERVELRTNIVNELLDREFDFTIDETMVNDPKTISYPADEDALRERWRRRVKYDLLVQKADGKTLEEAKERLRKRYDSYARRMGQIDNDELWEMYLTAMTTGYDPHTSFMSASTLENFEIDMKKELDGIGASLQQEDGTTIIHKVIPGGAADKDGRLKPRDQIVAVGQGEGGEMVDVVDMKLRDVVSLIRGKRGTIVRLGVISEGATKQEIYDVTRARIELNDSVARSEIIEHGENGDGTPFKVGVIDLPSFYMDMAAARLGRPDFRSTTRDVKLILQNFNRQGVDAVIMDLRRNGGGSLREAVNLTGLFIEEGPVVQVKGFDGRVEDLVDRDPEIDWRGPLVVLTSKFSASASEIFAGAIQDYGRGLIVGDTQTHGKGTVQQLLDIGQQILRVPNADNMGALKVTIQQFYRPSGDSTQNRGVLADIILPSITSHLDVGESDLDYALKFDRVDRIDYKAYGLADENIVLGLKRRSAERIKSSEDFNKVARDIHRYLDRKERKTVMLHEEKFMADRAELEAERKAAEEEEAEEEDPEHPIKQDYYFKEAMAITHDYVDELRKNKLAVR